MQRISSFFLIVLVCCAVSCKKSGSAPEAVGAEQQAVTEPRPEVVADDRGYVVKVGDEAPDFVIEYVDGRTEKLSDLRGKLVMLQFTASWCGVCRKEMPFIEKDIWSKHKNNPRFALIGIDLKENKETTVKFAQDMNVTYPLTLDTDGSRFALFAEPKAGVTRNILIDKEGKIILQTRLFEMEEFNEMAARIDDYLEKEVL